MRDELKFYIGGRWVDPAEPRTLEVINPADEQPAGRISLGSPKDVDAAAQAARTAFDSFSRTSREERIELLQTVLAEYQKRRDELAAAVRIEMGAPRSSANG
jgi:aldehyde dehydrogenase (NAD+)